MERPHLVESPRGNILDRSGNHKLAVDEPCIDACVDYRAVQDPPDEDWVKARALERLHGRWGGDAYAHCVSAAEAQRAGGGDRVWSNPTSRDVAAAGADLRAIPGADRRSAAGHRPPGVDATALRLVSKLRAGGGETRGLGRCAAAGAGSWPTPPLRSPQFDSFTSITVADQLEPHVVLACRRHRNPKRPGQGHRSVPGPDPAARARTAITRTATLPVTCWAASGTSIATTSGRIPRPKTNCATICRTT